MEKFLLINNKDFFDKKGVVTINKNSDIPNRDALLFIGSHKQSMDHPEHISKYFKEISLKSHQYIIIVGKGDGCLSPTIKIPENIIYIYSSNINYQHDTIKFMPMGSDFRSIQSFSKLNINNKSRNILCYSNFSLTTHKKRKIVHELIKDKKFIKFDHMGKFLNYSISRDQFYTNLSNSKFVICPRGNALDTFRFYDTIYAGAIPIVVKEKFHDSYFFKDVPILFMNDEKDFETLSESFLKNKYKELVHKKKSYYENLDMNNFINKLLSHLNLVESQK